MDAFRQQSWQHGLDSRNPAPGLPDILHPRSFVFPQTWRVIGSDRIDQSTQHAVPHVFHSIPRANGWRTFCSRTDTFVIGVIEKQIVWTGLRGDIHTFSLGISHCLDAFGPERVVYGSDWPVCVLAGDYAKVWKETNAALAGFTQDQVDAVLGGTAEKFYNLAGQQ